ncbi:toluene hydroxylase [Pseudonocardia acidicola]|uniref:propane 2-monooxygenase n=1 Tax=Pseudonocardia acidicola TaxID=2724939 RepID=A0ABX1S7C4_9PSEU|nr:toluene hydroxylase [Pseudonocardia acidicola]NMH97005.1 toluene hydroxylase [Pseudonocardia acidicola]
MSDNTAPRRRRTWSAFGDVRRLPSEYEVMTHETNWTLRAGRASAFEQNPSSAANLWFLTYRENSPLKAEDWNGFRDPDQLTYRAYVAHQNDEETKVEGLLAQFAEIGADAAHTDGWLRVLGTVFTPARYPLHGAQQVQAYIGHIAPSSYITNAAAFTAADLLRRVTRVAYRTRELELARPGCGIGTAERALWEDDPAWQGARKAIETALIAYDWAEAFTAMNLVLLPTLDDVLLTQFGRLAKANSDDLSWLLSGLLGADSKRRDRWSAALAAFAVADRPGNADVLTKWIDKWASRADEAAAGLAGLLASAPVDPPSVEDVVASARAARAALYEQAGIVPTGLAASG